MNCFNEYKDYETCKSCGGRCCRIYRHWDGQVEDWLEAFEESGATKIVQPIYDPFKEYRSECQYLGKNGCIIPWEFRPTVCRGYKCNELTEAIKWRNAGADRTGTTGKKESNP